MLPRCSIKRSQVLVFSPEILMSFVMIMFLFQGLCAQMFLKEKYLRRDILQEFCLSISEHTSTLWGTSLMSSSLSSFSVLVTDPQASGSWN